MRRYGKQPFSFTIFLSNYMRGSTIFQVGYVSDSI
nr:MAG TPA: hypothetical protein [Caudoviricetes sp.]